MISRSKSNTIRAFVLQPHQPKHLRGGFICRLHLFTAVRLQASERSLVQETCHKCQIVPPLHYLGCGADTPAEVSSRWWSRPSPPTHLHRIKFIWDHTGWSVCSLNILHMHFFSSIVYYRAWCLLEFSADSVGVHGGWSLSLWRKKLHGKTDGIPFFINRWWGWRGRGPPMSFSTILFPFHIFSFRTPHSIFISRAVSCIGPASFDFLCPFPTIHHHFRGEHLILAEQWAHCSRPSHAVHNQRHVFDRPSGVRDQEPIN